MTEKKKRKVHSPEYKAKVGLEALKGVKTINEIGQEYGVHPVQVGQWKKARIKYGVLILPTFGWRKALPTWWQSWIGIAARF